MSEITNFSELLKQYIERRFGKEGSAGELARAVNGLFGLDDSEGLKRQSINNWLRGSSPREWWQIAAMTCILCETEDEADELLQVAALDIINIKRSALEEQVLMDEITRKKVEAMVVQHWDEKSEKVAHDSSSINRPQRLSLGILNNRKIVIPLAFIALLIATLGFWMWNQKISAPAEAFKDDFSNSALCKSNWDFVESEYAQCDSENSVLQFNIPPESEPEWMADVVDSTLTGGYLLSRVDFTAALDNLSDPANLGNVGVQTDCHDEGTWMIVQIGGHRQSIYAEYGKNDVGEPDGMVPFGTVSLGQEYTIGLEWLPGGVQVTIDGELQERTIPCSQSEWLQLIAGGETDTHVRGYISDVQVWAR